MSGYNYPLEWNLGTLNNDLRAGNLVILQNPRRIFNSSQIAVLNSNDLLLVIDNCMQFTNNVWDKKQEFSYYDILSALVERFGYTKVYIGHYTKFVGKTVDFGDCSLKAVADPIDAQDVATKNFVSNQISTLSTSTTSNIASSLTTANSYTDAAVSTASTTLNASISAVQTQVSNILTGADTTSDTLAKVAALAQSLDTSETASLSSAVASLQGQINTKTTDITALQTLTAGYANEIDTALIKSTDPSLAVAFGSDVDLQYKNLKNAQLVDASTLQVSDVISDLFDGLVLSPDDCKFYGPNQIVLLETADICPDQDSTSNKFNGWVLTGTGIPPNTFIKNYRYDYSNWSSIYRCMYANLSNDIDDPSRFNYSYKLVKPISIQTSFNLNSFSLSNIADGINPADACAYHQLTDYKSSNDSALATIAANLALEASRADTVEKYLSSSISTESTRALP